MQNLGDSSVLGSKAGAKDKMRSPHKVLRFLAPALLCGAVIALAQPAKAASPLTFDAIAPADDSVAALTVFAQAVGTEQPARDEPYSALFDFARMVGGDDPQPIAVKV